MKTTEQTNVVGPLVRGRIGRSSVVHAAAELCHRFVLVLGQPEGQLVEDFAQMAGAMFEPVSYTHLDVYKRQVAHQDLG